MTSSRIRRPSPSVVAGAALFALLLAGTSARAQVVGPRLDLNTGPVPRSVEIADVNGDGHNDVIVAVQGANEVSIFRGNGDLTFQPRVDVATAANPIALAVVDWTADGKLDLLVGCAGDTSLTVYVGNGLGSFTAGASVHCPTVPYQIEVGDVTGDGRLDAVIAADEPTVALFDVPGTALGGFAAPRIWLTDPTARSRSLALAQIDGQPGIDIYLATQQGSSRILRNNGAGGFLAPTLVNGSATSYGVALGDWSGDGILDAVEVGPAVATEGWLRLLRGSPGGTFVLDRQVGAPGSSRAPALAELDSHAGLDVAFVSPATSQLVLALTSCGYALGPVAGVDLTPEDLELGDLDHDGDPDFVTANFGGASVSIRQNLGTASGAAQGCDPDPVANPAELIFSELGTGIPSTLPVTVTNVGSGAVTLLGATADTPEFTVLTTFPVAVTAGVGAVVQVRSNRLAVGTFVDTLRITTSDQNEPLLLVPMTTRARVPTAPQANVPGIVIFPLGVQGSPGVAPLPVGNTGELDLVISSVTTGTAEFRVESPLPFVVPPGQVRDLLVGVLRTNQGTVSDTLRAESNDPDGPPIVVPLVAATREPMPIPLVISPPLAFGTEAISIAETLAVAVKNVGEEPFAITTMTSSHLVYSALTTFPVAVTPGNVVSIPIRYSRPSPGTHDGFLRFFTDDPLHPNFEVTVTGSTSNSPPPRVVVDALVEFGTVIAGTADTHSAEVISATITDLHVSALTTSTPWFTVLNPQPFTLTHSGASRDILIRLQRNELGEAHDTLVVHSNDPDVPAARVPLHGTIIPPPAIALGPGIAPVELAFGATASRTLLVGNPTPSASLSVVASVVVDSVQAGAVVDAGATTPPAAGAAGAGEGTSEMPAFRLDPEGHSWDVRGDGSIGTGDPGGFAGSLGGGLARTGFPVLPTSEMRDGGRAFHLATTQGGLVLERTIHVSPFEPWIRYLDTVTNPGASPVAVSIPIRSRIDLALPRTASTSSGDLVFQPADDWVVVEDDLAPVIAHVIAGPGALRPVSTSLTGGTRDVQYTFAFTLGPGESGAILHYALQAATLGEAVERAEALRTPFGPALAGLAVADRLRVRNFALGGVFSLPVTDLFVAPLTQQGLLVGFDAGLGSGDEETVFGTLRLASNDPSQPLVTVPLELRISAATGPDPLPVEPLPGGTLALAARFVPNPARSGRVELSYVLPVAGSARFDLYDVRGRRIGSRTLADAPAGPGSIRWGAIEGALPAGVVWMRLTHGGRAVTTKAVVLP